MTASIILISISYLSVLFVVLPMVKSDFWIFRALEYSRFQNLFLSAFIVALWLIYWQWGETIAFLPFLLNVLCVGYLFFKILPYTIFWKKEVKTLKIVEAGKGLKLINANVLQTNTEYARLLTQIQRNNTDVVLLLETDKRWQEAMAPLKEDLPYTIEVPQDNTYGMLFYSRYPIEDEKIRFLVKDDVPSISCKIVLPSGDKLKLWGLHPEPPVLGESLTSTAKDKELSMVALKVKDCKSPVIVMGDLNDVAWSDTTSLFTKTSGLLDVRKGRGFYSTFSAHHWFMRFPLDYIFCSPHFGFIKMTRLSKNGSDHFPIFTHLVLHPPLENLQEKDNLDDEVLDEANEKANQTV